MISEIRRDRDIAILELSGRLTQEEQATDFENTIEALLGAGTRSVILDVHGLTYLDEVGVALLASAHVELTKRSGTLVLLSPTPRVLQRLALCKLDTVIPIVYDVRAAEARVRDNLP